MAEKVIKIGIMSREDYKRRTIAIAKGQYVPKTDEPKIWFESLQSMAQVLNMENQRVLQLIMDEHPQSLKELEELTGRSSSNLSRTLKTMAHYGIVELERKNRRLVPKVKASAFQVEFGIRRQGQG